MTIRLNTGMLLPWHDQRLLKQYYHKQYILELSKCTIKSVCATAKREERKHNGR